MAFLRAEEGMRNELRLRASQRAPKPGETCRRHVSSARGESQDCGSEVRKRRRRSNVFPTGNGFFACRGGDEKRAPASRVPTSAEAGRNVPAARFVSERRIPRLRFRGAKTQKKEQRIPDREWLFCVPRAAPSRKKSRATPCKRHRMMIQSHLQRISPCGVGGATVP